MFNVKSVSFCYWAIYFLTSHYHSYILSCHIFFGIIVWRRLTLAPLIYHSCPIDSHHGAIKTPSSHEYSLVELEGSPWSHRAIKAVLCVLETHLSPLEAHFGTTEAYLETLKAHIWSLGGSPWISGCPHGALNQKALHGLLIRQSWGYIPHIVQITFSFSKKRVKQLFNQKSF
jgi:hypothetical protein